MRHIFVYGTLKTGQRRESQWPVRPASIRAAWTRGRLYDTGPYPALVVGDDRVAGQVWSFPQEHWGQTLLVLDEIEGTDQPGQKNLYDRAVVEVFVSSGLGSDSVTDAKSDSAVRASLYLYARHENLARFRYIAPRLHADGECYASWPPEPLGG